jgi:hypothetical protein
MTVLALPERTKGHWQGVLMIIRPDMSKHSELLDPMCQVLSARIVQLDGRRAISAQLPYSMFKDMFSSDDEDHIYRQAEWKDGHLEFYGPSNRREWVMFSAEDDAMQKTFFTGYQ